MQITVVSPPENKQLAKISSCCCSSSFQGGGQQHSLLQHLSPHRRATGKPAYWLCQLLSSPAGWNTSFVCVKQKLYQSADVSTGVPSTTITTATPPRNATQRAQKGGDEWHQNQSAVQQPHFARTAHLKWVLATTVLTYAELSLVKEQERLLLQLFSILTWLYTCFLVI